MGTTIGTRTFAGRTLRLRRAASVVLPSILVLGVVMAGYRGLVSLPTSGLLGEIAVRAASIALVLVAVLVPILLVTRLERRIAEEWMARLRAGSSPLEVEGRA
jgi:hypothetical protein